MEVTCMSTGVLESSTSQRRTTARGTLRVLVSLVLPAAVLAASLPGPHALAAGVDPLPAVAKALATVTSYQVTITTSAGGGRPPRRSGTAPRGTPTPRQGS